MSKIIEGPDQYWSAELPPSRGQWKDIALVALELLGVPTPESRLDATVAMVRLRTAVTEQTPTGGGPAAMVSRIDVARAKRAVRMDRAAAELLVEREALALLERRARRQPTGRHGKQHRCQGCNKFMSSREGCCVSCGYRQGVGWAA